MNRNPASEGVLIGIPDIAQIAGVNRTAVSNWRKRYRDFPVPVVDTPSGVLFDVAEVERWLIDRGTITQRIPVANLLWRQLEAMRSGLSSEAIEQFAVSVLVYLEACDRADVVIDDADQWPALQVLDPAHLVDALERVARNIERDIPVLQDLLRTGFEMPDRFGVERDDASNVAGHVHEVIETLAEMTREDSHPRAELFDEVVERFHARERFSEAGATPPALAELLARVGRGAGVVFDPACGEGSVLVRFVEANEARASAPRLIGWDIDEETMRRARARLFLNRLDGELEARSSLAAAPSELPRADVVILDPPYNQRAWGTTDDYVSDRWTFGAPSPKSANMAWLQTAFGALADGGRALVLLPASSLTSTGREQNIRAEMLQHGVIEAVVLLPSRLRRDFQGAIALWVLTPKRAGADSSVLLVDASALGEATRSIRKLQVDDIEKIAFTLERWREHREVVADVDDVAAVAIAPSRLVDAKLDPTLYRPPVESVDLDRLLVERGRVVSELKNARSRQRAADQRLLGLLEEHDG